MIRRGRHRESHLTGRIGWLRASVLGANDGIVSTASLILGVAAATDSPRAVLVAGAAGLVSGALSMATGEFVSVSSQADAEHAELARERRELRDQVESEQDELARIYVQRGLEPQLARRVALDLMAHDALGAHARDELGISDISAARPLQAAMASAASFTAGAALPLLVALLCPMAWMARAVAATSLVFLATLGAVAAKSGGSNMTVAAARVTGWGALAMAVTTGIGLLLDQAIA